MGNEPPPMVLRGRAFPPMQSRATEAELRIGAERAVLAGADGAFLADLPRQDLRFEARLGSAPRRASLPDGTLFETDDHDLADALAGRSAGGVLHGLERFHPRLAAVLVAIVAAGWLIWRYGLDLLAGAAIALTPAPVINAIDNGSLKTADLTIASPSEASDGERAQAEAILARLLATLDPEARAAHDFQLAFRSIPGLGPNAIALPGGTIVVTDEFLRLFPSEDVQAGVLAHEVGHVVGQHGLRQLYRSLGVAVLIALLAGDTVPIVEDIVLEGNVLLSLSFSRRSERAADDFGMRLARDAGYDPAGLIAFFDWIAETYGDGSSWLSTHPSSAERSETLRRLTGER